jgi:hypothetical protein
MRAAIQIPSVHGKAWNRRWSRRRNSNSQSQDWSWPTNWTEREILTYGALAAALLSKTDKWIYRRVDSVRFEQSETRFCTSVDFEIPQAALSFITESLERPLEHIYVPIAVLEKRPIADLDIRDEHGGSVPTLTRFENRLLAREMLAYLITLCVGEHIHPEVGNMLDGVINQPVPAHAQKWADKLLKDSEPTTDRKLASQIERIRTGEELARSFITMLTDGFPFFVCLSPNDGLHRILKFSYTGSVSKGHASLRKEHMQGHVWSFETRHAKTALSHHYEVCAPDGIVLRDVVRIRKGSTTVDHFPPENIARHPSRINVVLEPDEPANVLAVATLPREGLLTGALISSIVTCAMLVVVAVITNKYAHQTQTQTHAQVHAQTDNQPAVGLLLAIPAAVINLYFTRLTEHPTARRVFARMRAALLASVAASITAAVLAVALVGLWSLFWIAAFVFGGASVVSLAHQWVKTAVRT